MIWFNMIKKFCEKCLSHFFFSFLCSHEIFVCWIIHMRKATMFFRIWNWTPTDSLSTYKESYRNLFSVTSVIPHLQTNLKKLSSTLFKETEQLYFRDNPLNISREKHSHSYCYPQETAWGRGSTLTHICWVYRGSLKHTPPVRNSSILSSSSPCYVSPYRCN